MINKHEKRFYDHYSGLVDTFKNFGDPYTLILGDHSQSGAGEVYHLEYKLESHSLKEVYNRTYSELCNSDTFRNTNRKDYLLNNFRALWCILEEILRFYETNKLYYDLKELILQEQ